MTLFCDERRQFTPFRRFSISFQGVECLFRQNWLKYSLFLNTILFRMVFLQCVFFCIWWWVQLLCFEGLPIKWQSNEKTNSIRKMFITFSEPELSSGNSRIFNIAFFWIFLSFYDSPKIKFIHADCPNDEKKQYTPITKPKQISRNESGTQNHTNETVTKK